MVENAIEYSSRIEKTGVCDNLKEHELQCEPGRAGPYVGNYRLKKQHTTWTVGSVINHCSQPTHIRSCGLQDSSIAIFFY